MRLAPRTRSAPLSRIPRDGGSRARRSFGLALLLAAAAAGCGQRHDRERIDAGAPSALRPVEPARSFADLASDSAVDPSLQAALEAAEGEIAARLGISPGARSWGVLDLESGKLAWSRPDTIFYGASVPKVCIVLAYFELHPEAARELDSAVQRELELVLKRSSNELAAKYSREIGLDRIQALQLSERYRLYDPRGPGGLWSGKHYGIDQPERGDPLAGFSHTATVRQCLRFFLLLEEEKLVDRDVSRRIRRLFETPRLEHHDTGFVRGLRDRGVALIRKEGDWEDWHLDAGRVEGPGRRYLIAAMARHARGDEYLAELARAVDERLGGARSGNRARAELIADELGEIELPRPDGRRTFESRVFSADRPFSDVLISWNAAVPQGSGIFVELRVGRSFDGSWSPWLHAGEWGRVPATLERRVEFPGGGIDVDYFHSRERWDVVQWRMTSPPAEPGQPPRSIPAPADSATGAASSAAPGATRIERVTLALSDRSGLPYPSPPPAPRAAPALAPSAWQRRLAVPYRSQMGEDPEIARRICSPTSLAMVLEYRGVDVPTAAVAARAYDPIHRIYGNWPRSIQAAYSLGVPGYLTRFADWDEARRSIAAGQPLIISVRTDAPEDLPGAPQVYREGHLLVLCGFEGEDRVLVNDPAARDAASGGVASYPLAALEKAWLENGGGTAYVLLDPAAAAGRRR